LGFVHESSSDLIPVKSSRSRLIIPLLSQRIISLTVMAEQFTSYPTLFFNNFAIAIPTAPDPLITIFNTYNLYTNRIQVLLTHTIISILSQIIISLTVKAEQFTSSPT